MPYEHSRGHGPGENGGGGPKTPEGRARALANLDSDHAAISHGCRMTAGRFLPCDKCLAAEGCEHRAAGDTCAIEREFVQGRRGQLLAVEHLAPLDLVSVELLIDVEVRLLRGHRALSAVGEIVRTEAGLYDVQPLASYLSKLQAQRERLLKGLRLEPSPAADSGPRGMARLYALVTEEGAT
jgi:hypothetical protein